MAEGLHGIVFFDEVVNLPADLKMYAKNLRQN
jgi:hypothetical protein